MNAEATEIPSDRSNRRKEGRGVWHPDGINFSNPTERAEHLRAFLDWLPKVLRNAPGIHWDLLPSPVMGYLIHTVAESPDATSIALAMGCSLGAIKQNTVFTYCRELTRLLRRLRTHYGMSELTQLGTRSIWESFAAGRTLSGGDVNMLVIYDALASTHLPTYLEGLNERQRMMWEPYALPPLPAGFMDKYGLRKAAGTAAEKRRKEQSDVLVPLFPLLIEIAQLRKQTTERLINVFRRHRDRVIAGEIALPYHFQYTDHLSYVTQDSPTISAVEIIEREVTLSLTLWDRASWVKAHPERYGKGPHASLKRQVGAYAPECNTYFLQYVGSTDDLLWWGDLIAKRLIGKPPRSTSGEQGEGPKPQKDPRRICVRSPGLLSPTQSDSQWLAHASQPGEVLIEPESLYRGVLYATALATLALTNGSRVSELLQVSAVRFETIAVDEVRNQQPTGRKIGILVQNLLPKGYTKESERQFFLIGEMAGRLLTEIGQLLEATHGGTIPVVQPYQNTKAEDLIDEPYLFQWNARADRRMGLLTPRDVAHLLRFLFDGLTLTTRTGKPIQVVPHLLRHVLATHARQVKHVPAEAVAYLLHHRVTLSNETRTLSIPEATAYYSRMTLEQLLALLFEAQSTLPSLQGRSYLQAPPRTLEQMNEALRQVFEQWSTIGPTVLGYCSAGLCVRPDNRALCLGCRFLVPHYSNLPHARTWRKLYVLQEKMHKAHGHHIDAQQARQMIHYLDDIINLMQIQIKARQDGGYLPFADTLPPAIGEEREE